MLSELIWARAMYEITASSYPACRVPTYEKLVSHAKEAAATEPAGNGSASYAV